jgi:hypothetical protein
MALVHRAATIGGAGILADMNQQLIEDERHRNQTSLTELETRMRSLLETG